MRCNVNFGSKAVNLDTKIKPWLKINSNIGYAYSESIQNGQIVGSENVFEFADKMAPIFPVFLRDNNGELVPDTNYGGFQYDYGSLSGFRDRPNANGLNPIGSALYDFNGTDNASGTYPEGSTIVNWIATDSSGNSATCSINVTGK